MIKIEVKNQDRCCIGRIDHEKPLGPLSAQGEEQAVLGIKNYAYQPEDQIVVTTEKEERYFVVQLDESLAPTLLYLPQRTWSYQIPLTAASRMAGVDTAFRSERHHIMIRKAHDFEISRYQNLTANTHDQKNFSGAFPHAKANVETRDEAVFFAKNAIDGKYANRSHGSYPFASWGINQQANAELRIEFGRLVEIDWVRLLFRGDYPHDSYWQTVTLAFSDGEETVQTTNVLAFQDVRFSPRKTTFICLKNLKQAADDSPFPALTQIEAFGSNCL